MDGAEWYYSNEGQRLGPISFEELKSQVGQGRLGPDDLVWREGWSEWLPASRVNGLKKKFGASEQPGALGDGLGADSVQTSSSHFLDYFLDILRALFPQTDLAGIAEIMVEFGRYSLYVAMSIWLIFTFIHAIKIDSLDWVLYGVGGVLIALSLQYSAVRLTLAMPRLIRSTPTRMSSAAFLDSFAVIMIISGVLWLAAFTLWAIRYEYLNYFFIGVGIFFGCEQCALLSLNPDALNIRISEEASSGEEAVGIISFFLMLPMRFVPVVFGIGATVGTVGLLACSLYYLKGGESVETAMTYAPVAVGVVFGCAAFPLLMYIYFVFDYLILDVIRSILVIPSKIDRLSERQQAPQSRSTGEQ